MMPKGKLDVLLINPASREQVYQSLGKRLAAVENPVWAGLMASFCRAHGLAVEILDAEAEGFPAGAIAERIAYERPTLAAVVVYGHQPSASTQVMTAASQACTAIKQTTPEQPVLLVGGHVAALPRQTLHEEAADFVAAGEGLLTLVGLVEALQSPVPSLDRVPGLWYRRDGEVRHTVDVPLVSDLDQVMSGPAWDLLPMSRYRAHNWHCLGGRPRQPYAALYTTLGCPYHCSFCCIQAPFRSGERASGLKASTNSYRYFSPETVIDQIDTLVNQYGVRNIKIADEMFVLNRRHVLALCDLLIERRFDLNLWAYARVDTIKDDMVDKLKAAGFHWLAIGIEAGADRVRADVDKAFCQEDLYRVLGPLRDSGISVIGNYIFGLPEDDEDTMQATLDLALDLKCEFANFYSAMAYPGSPLYERAVRQGVPLPRARTGYAQHARDCLPLPTRYLTAAEVLRFRDDAFMRYYGDRSYLETVQRRFGAEAVDEIRQMTVHRLDRDLLGGRLNVPLITWPEENAPRPLAPRATSVSLSSPQTASG
jgi:anaerobic magnesium-protoporphyrin IX monomethyl ester cyclase